MSRASICVYSNRLLIFLLFVCVFSSLPGISESWKLRDRSTKNENVTSVYETESTVTPSVPSSRTPLEKNSVSRELPVIIKKTTATTPQILVDDDNDDEDDDSLANVEDDNDDQDSMEEEVEWDDKAEEESQEESEEEFEQEVEIQNIIAEEPEDVPDDHEENDEPESREGEDDNTKDTINLVKSPEKNSLPLKVATSLPNVVSSLPKVPPVLPKVVPAPSKPVSVPPKIVPAQPKVVPVSPKIVSVPPIPIKIEPKTPEPLKTTTTTDSVPDKNFVFEKVRPSHYDTSKVRPKVTHPDVEQDEKEDEELKEEEKFVESFLSPLWRLTSGQKSSSQNVEQKLSFFESFNFFGKSEENQKDQASAEKSAQDEPTAKQNWLSAFDIKPFSIIFDYFRDENNSLHLDNAPRDDAEQDDDLIEKSRSPLTTETFEELLLKIPSFVPNYTKIENANCRRLGQIFLRQIRGQKLWAVQMLDASSKIPSGLLRGNANQFGDFDLCTDIRTKVILKDDQSLKIKGKYCLANVDIRASDEEMKLAVHLMQGRNLLRSRFEDPSHFLPRFSTLKWGICVPHGCTNNDAAAIVHNLLSPYNVTGVKLFVDVSEEGCYVKSRTNWSEITRQNWRISGTIAYFLFIIALVIVASLNDYWKQLKLDLLFAPDSPREPNHLIISNKRQSSTEFEPLVEVSEMNERTEVESDAKAEGLVRQIILAFSIKRTSSILFDSKSRNENIVSSIYGLKAVATIMLFICYKFLMIGHQPFTNRAYLTEVLTSPPSILLRGFILYADLLLLINGFHAAQSLSNDLKNFKHISFPRRLIGRLLRVTPPLVIVVLFNAWILEHMGNGPQWGTLIGHNADLCKQNAWPTFLHIANWVPFEMQCAPYLVSISIEMQLYLVMPLFVWLLNKNEAAGVALFGVITTFSIGLRFSDTISERLSTIVFHGMKLSQLYRTINLSFTSPVHRVFTYFIGAGFAVIINNSDKEARLPKLLNVFGWIASAFAIVWCFYIPTHLAYKDYVYDPNEAADYAAWAPVLWSVPVCWIIYVCTIRSSNLLDRILTIKPLVVLGKISFEIYLVQFLVLFYFAASARSLEPFKFGQCLNFLEIALIIFFATILALFLGIPLQTIRKIIIDGGQCCDAVETKSAELEDERKVDAILGSDQSKIDGTNSSDSPTQKRRVSWSDKVVTEEPVIFRRPPTPVWLKDEENVQDFWDNDDEIEEIDTGYCNGVAENNREDDPVEITLSDLEDDLPHFSDDDAEAVSDDERED